MEASVLKPRSPSGTDRDEHGRENRRPAQRRLSMLWAIVVILIVLWLLGFVANIAGGLVHLLLVLAILVFLWQLLSGRRRI